MKYTELYSTLSANPVNAEVYEGVLPNQSSDKSIVITYESSTPIYADNIVYASSIDIRFKFYTREYSDVLKMHKFMTTYFNTSFETEYQDDNEYYISVYEVSDLFIDDLEEEEILKEL